MEIFSFALFTRFEDNLRFLASLSNDNDEEWEYSDPQKELQEGNNSARYSFPILRNYFEYTYQKLHSENRIVFAEGERFACFNTGLVTRHYEEIFAFFEENKSYNKQSPYFFKAFLKESDREFLSYYSTNIPQRANYFDKPERLLFNPQSVIIKNIDHILQDNKLRFPAPLRNATDREIRNQLNGAIEEVTKMAKINYKLGIPQWYKGEIQLLLPLYLTHQNKADLALSLEYINEKTYRAGAVLTKGMAYNNARLIVAPQSNWLQP
ncbi:MAG TPA: DUF3825 domain-containing protein [Puia sp.]|jgi:hypothetical protein|nr:DUF3825 domain-containing protein [Puia sp.]